VYYVQQLLGGSMGSDSMSSVRASAGLESPIPYDAVRSGNTVHGTRYTVRGQMQRQTGTVTVTVTASGVEWEILPVLPIRGLLYTVHWAVGSTSTLYM
jgi:hypothetical protein